MHKGTIAAGLGFSCALLLAGPAAAQWAAPGGNAQRTGWQKSEPRITATNAASIRLLWKLPLGGPDAGLPAPTEPLVAGSVITEEGFKNMALVMVPGNNLVDVDYELGRVVWSRHFDVQISPAQACPNGQLATALIQPPQAFNRGTRGARRGPATPGRRGLGRTPAPSSPSLPRVNFGGVGGVFAGMRGVYVLTNDGEVHELRLANGADYGEPVQFLPGQDSSLSDALISNGEMYVETTGDCGGRMSPAGVWTPAPNGIWAIDGATPAYAVSAHATEVNPGGLDGPASSTDGSTLYLTTGPRLGGGGGGPHPDSVVALDAATLEVTDYYTPAAPPEAAANVDVSPAVFADNGRDLIAAYGDDGRLVVLDSAALGGADHHTPLAASPRLTGGAQFAWGRLATAELNGTRWIYVSIHGPLEPGVAVGTRHGAAPDGSVVAFTLSGQGGQTTLTPVWASANLLDPSPAVIASGHVFVLANGSAAHNARLVALDASTGALQYSSGARIASPAHLASLSLADGQVLFVTADNTLYNFGIGIEH